MQNQLNQLRSIPFSYRQKMSIHRVFLFVPEIIVRIVINFDVQIIEMKEKGGNHPRQTRCYIDSCIELKTATNIGNKLSSNIQHKYFVVTFTFCTVTIHLIYGFSIYAQDLI